MKTYSELRPARCILSERDTRRVLALLKNPPAANDRLMRVARAGLVVLPLAEAAEAIKRGS
jgi:hypothetical protein